MFFDDGLSSDDIILVFQKVPGGSWPSEIGDMILDED